MNHTFKYQLLFFGAVYLACHSENDRQQNIDIKPPKVVEAKTYRNVNVSPPQIITVNSISTKKERIPVRVKASSTMFSAKVVKTTPVTSARLTHVANEKYSSPETTPAIDSPYEAGVPELTNSVHGIVDNNSGYFSYIKAINGLLSNEVSNLIQDKKGNLWISAWWGGVSRYDGQSLWNYTLAEGLSSDIVHCVYEDTKSNIWIGTQIGGVNKLDGRYITQYSVTEGLGDSSVYDILEDKNGNMWFATDRGLSRYDGSTFTRFSTTQGLPSNRIRCLMEDGNGNLWVGAYGGPARFDGRKFTNYGSVLEVGGENLVSDMIQDRDGNIWFGTDTGLFKYTGKQINHYTIKSGLSSNEISSLMEEINGDIWVGTLADGANRFDGTSFTHFRASDGLANDNISSIRQDKQGNIWLTTTAGVCRYNAKMFSHIFPLQQEEIECVLADSKGNIWMGSGAGRCLNRFDGEYLFRYTRDNGLTSTRINQIIEDKNGNIWFGTWDGVDVYDGEKFIHYSSDQGLIDNIVFCLFEDNTGCIWFGTSKGLSKFDGKSFTNFGRMQGLCSEVIVALGGDADGNIWIGTTDRGVCSFNGKSFTHYDLARSVSHPFVVGIINDRNNNMWFCTSKGINKFDGKFFTWYTTEQGLSNNITKNIVQDKEGNIWVGTINGLNKLLLPDSGVSERTIVSYFKKYTAAEGFSGRGTYENSICMDKSGYIWIGANDRLTRYHPENDVPDTIPPAITLTDILVFGEKVDWVNLSKYKDTAIALKNGSQLKASFNDLTPWNNLPKNLRLVHNNNHLTFQFTGITTQRQNDVKYKYMLVGLENAWNITDQHSATYMNLPHGDFIFKIKCITSEGYTSDEFHYSLTILAPWWQTPWAYASYAIAVVMIVWFFTWYRSRWLEAENLSLEQKVSIKTLELEQSFEERLLLSKKLESQQALLNERVRISRELHDDIGSTLGSISIYSEVARKRAGKNENPDIALAKIGSASRELIEKMNDIIWSLNLNTESFQQMLDRMNSFAALTLAPQNIRYNFIVPEQSKAVHLTSIQAKNTFLIFKEALHNIVKYAQCQTVCVNFHTQDDKLTMFIADDGKGFHMPPAETPVANSGGGNGLKNMSTRAAEINALFQCKSELNAGTTIILIVPL